MLPFYCKCQGPEGLQDTRYTHWINSDYDAPRIVFLLQCVGDTGDSATSPSASDEDINLSRRGMRRRRRGGNDIFNDLRSGSVFVSQRVIHLQGAGDKSRSHHNQQKRTFRY